MSRSSRSTGVHHTVVEIVNRGIRVTSPSRERSRLAASTKDCKGQDEDENLGAAIKCGTDDVVVLDEQFRVAATNEPLRDETDDEEHADTGIDADEQPAHVPQDDGHVQVFEHGMFGVAVSQPEWYGDDEADEVRKGDPLVSAANGEELGGHRPSDGKGIESKRSCQQTRLVSPEQNISVLLNILATPNVTARNGFQDRALVLDNGDHPMTS